MLFERRSVILALSALLGAAALVACGADDDHEHGGQHEDEDPFEDACIHLDGGPFERVSAAADRAEALADVSTSHTAFEIALTDLGGGDKGGFVAYAATEDGEYYFFLDGDVSLEVLDATGAGVGVHEMGVGSEACEAIGNWFEYDLQVGTYALSLGPTAAETVTLVSVPADGDTHQH